MLAQFSQLQPEHPTEVISAGTIYHAQQHVHQIMDDGGQAAHAVEVTKGWVAPYVAQYETGWLLDVGGWDESFPGSWGWDDTDLLTRLRMSGVGQHIALGIEAVHQWHGYGGDANSQNEAHFFAKRFNEEDMTHVVANQGREWGVLNG